MNKELSYTPPDTKTFKRTEQGKFKISFEISIDELQYYTSLLSILYNLKINGKPVLKASEVDLAGLSKMALKILANNYKNNVLADDGVIDTIPVDDEKTFENLLSFRAKYLDYPLDQQIADLKAKGVLA